MKYLKIILLSLLFSSSPNALSDNTDFYVNARAVQANGQQDLNNERRESTQIVTRVGIRHRQTVMENIVFDADVRAVYEYGKFTNLSDSNTYIELKRFSVEIPTLFNSPLSTKIGRMTFRDKQSWWYDNELDAVKLFHKETLFSWDLSFAGRLSDERANAGDQRVSLEGTKNIIGHIDYHYYYQHHFEAFGMYEDNGEDKNPLGVVVDFDNRISEFRKLSWIGARVSGEFDKKYSYWGNIAYVDGDTQSLGFTANADGFPQVTSVSNISVSGVGLDFGGIYRTADYGFGFSYAYGQGSNGEGSSQDLYIQPNNSNNKGNILGTTRYRYYGEMLDPQLSNIQILSLFAGITVFENTYLEFNYHKYIQNTASTQLRSSNLFIQTNGEDKDIGQEIDVIWGGKFENGQEIQLVISGFFGGDAFSNVSQQKDGYRAVIDYKYYW